jgi:hypothetical protein
MATGVQFGNVDNPAPAKVMTRAEAADLFDATAMLYLGISGTEFLRRWDDGVYRDETACTSRVMRVACMIPLVRKEERAGKHATTRAR